MRDQESAKAPQLHGSPSQQKPFPALAQLGERLKMNGVDTKLHSIATAILGLAHAHNWNTQPDRFVEWLAQLAQDLVHSRSSHLP
jgi:hypothetical protein